MFKHFQHLFFSRIVKAINVDYFKEFFLKDSQDYQPWKDPSKGFSCLSKRCCNKYSKELSGPSRWSNVAPSTKSNKLLAAYSPPKIPNKNSGLLVFKSLKILSKNHLIVIS